MPAPHVFAATSSILGLQEELAHANRMLQTSLKEVRESRKLIDEQQTELRNRSTIISDQQKEILEWMHSACAAQVMNKKLRSLQQQCWLTPADQMAECVIESAQSDVRFRHTALLVMALERLAENQN